MTPEYSGMYWSDKLDLSRIKAELRIFGNDYTGGLVVDAWDSKSRPGLIGVPIQWARSKGYQGTDKTVYPYRQWKNFNGKYRYNQANCVDKLASALISRRGALLESPTGWGKTVAALSVASELSTPTLVLVHKQDLVGQWHDSTKRFFNESCGMIQGDTWDFQDKAVTVGMIQTLRSRGVDAIKDAFGLIIVDEGHHIPCQTVSDILSQMPARYRLGVSATWRRKDGLANLWKWHLGAIEAQGVRPQLPAKYYQLTVKSAGLNDRAFVRWGKIQHSNMVTHIANCPQMNQEVRKQVAAAIRKGRQILVLTHRLAQVDHLVRTIPAAMAYTNTLDGKKQSPEEIEAASKSQVVVSTFGKIAEGTDIPRLDTLILATPCSDPEQAVGRISREFSSKKSVIVVDLIAPSAYNYVLARKREKVYERLNLRKGN